MFLGKVSAFANATNLLPVGAALKPTLDESLRSKSRRGGRSAFQRPRNPDSRGYKAH
jgi:hypothetical protein